MTDRAEEIRQVVMDVQRRRGAGDSISDDHITSAHPELLPELQGELKKLALIESARETAADNTQPTSIVAEDADTVAERQAAPASSEAVHLQDFELLSPIGRGGFGEVWVARHRLHGEFCAVKLVDRHPEVELDGIRIYRQRAKDHSGLVPIEHVGETEQSFYFVMPLADDVKGSAAIRGPEQYEPMTLEWCLKNQPPPPIEDVIDLGIELLDSIAALHRAGLAHQDIKPANVMMFGGRWKLGDLGLLARNDQLSGDRGTVAFWPPEGPRSSNADLYALGKTLFLVATGLNLVRFHEFANGELKLAGDPQRVERFSKVIMRACHDDASQRFVSAEEMSASLQDVIGTPTTTASPPQSEPVLAPARQVPRSRWSKPLIIGVIGVVVPVFLAISWGMFKHGDPVVDSSGKPPADPAPSNGFQVFDTNVHPGSQPHGFEVSGSLSIACNRPGRGPDGRARVLAVLPSPVHVGDQLRVNVNHQTPVSTFVLRLREDGHVALLHPTEGPAARLQPISSWTRDFVIQEGDVSRRSGPAGRLSGFVVIASETVPFTEWLDNLNVAENTPGRQLSWSGPNCTLGWKYDSTRNQRLQLLSEDAAASPRNPAVEMDSESREAGRQLQAFCKLLKNAPNSIHVWAICFPSLSPGS